MNIFHALLCLRTFSSPFQIYLTDLMRGLVRRGTSLLFFFQSLKEDNVSSTHCCCSLFLLIFLCQRHFLDMITLCVIFPYLHTCSKQILSDGTVLSMLFFNMNLQAALRLQRCDTCFNNKAQQLCCCLLNGIILMESKHIVINRKISCLYIKNSGQYFIGLSNSLKSRMQKSNWFNFDNVFCNMHTQGYLGISVEIFLNYLYVDAY